MNKEMIDKLKKISVSLAMLSMLVSCNENKKINNNERGITNTITPTKSIEILTDTPSPNNTSTLTPTPEVSNAPKPSNTEEPNKNNIMEEFKEGIKSNLQEVSDFYKNGKGAEALAVGKEYSIKFIDFMFYGGEIGGMTFDSFSDDFKLEVYSYLQDMDYILTKIDPDYKEEFGERYSIVKDFSLKEYNQSKNYIISKIGEEKYQDIISKKDLYWGIAKDKISEYKDKIFDFLNKKYQNYKNEQ